MLEDPAIEVTETGAIMYSSRIQRTLISIEAQCLFMRYVFDDLGYRCCDWKCGSLNALSCRAAG